MRRPILEWHVLGGRRAKIFLSSQPLLLILNGRARFFPYREAVRRQDDYNDGANGKIMASDDSLAPRVVAANVAMMVVSSLVIACRVTVSAVMMRNFWIDDGQYRTQLLRGPPLRARPLRNYPHALLHPGWPSR